MNPWGFAIAAIGVILVVIGWRNSRGKVWGMLSGGIPNTSGRAGAPKWSEKGAY